MTCKDCPITRAHLPLGAWAHLKSRAPRGYGGFLIATRQRLCPVMTAGELQRWCRPVMVKAAKDTAKLAKRSMVGYYGVVVASLAAKAADFAQVERATAKRRGVGPQPIGELLSGGV